MKGYSQNFKKGNVVLEAITVLLVLTVFAIAGLYAFQSFDEVNTDMQTNNDISTNAKTTSQNLYNIFPSWIDNAFLVIFVLFVVFIVVSVFFIDSHPIFFGVTIILLLGVVVSTIFIGNIYDDIASDETIQAYSNQLPYIYWVMTHIAELIITIIFITAIALFAKIKMT